MPIKAQAAGNWLIGGTIWTKNGPRLRFGELKVESKGGQHIFNVQVYLNDLDPKSVRVELYADGVNGGSPDRQEMKLVRPLVGATGRLRLQCGCVCNPAGWGLYGASNTRIATAVAIPLESARILWQR